MGVVISCFAMAGGTGISNVLFHTARAAYRTGALDAVICYGNRQSEIPANLIRPIRFQPVHIVSFLKARYYYTLKRMALDRRAARHIRRHGCDIFHGWTTECLHSLEEAKRVGAKTIVERPAPHPATAWRLLREEYERWGVPLPRDDGSRWLAGIDWEHRDAVIAPMEFSLADRVVVQSEFGLRSFIEQGFPPGKMVILPRAVDLKQFPPPAEPKDDLFRVLYVGTVCLRKGFLDLLHAWTGLALPGGELWVVGAVHEEIVPFLAACRDDPSIRFFGHVREGAEPFFPRLDGVRPSEHYRGKRQDDVRSDGGGPAGDHHPERGLGRPGRDRRVHRTDPGTRRHQGTAPPTVREPGDGEGDGEIGTGPGGVVLVGDVREPADLDLQGVHRRERRCLIAPD